MIVAYHECVIQGDLFQAAASFFCAPVASVIQQDAAHRLCGNSEEMRPILPFHVMLSDEVEVSFVYQRGGLEGMIGPFPAQAGRCQVAEFGIDQRDQLIRSVRIAQAELGKKLGDISGGHLPYFSPMKRPLQEVTDGNDENPYPLLLS
jgi:hypothetical protein